MAGILILGGGFAGVKAALAAANEIERNASALDVTLVSATEHITIRPRLYQRAPETLRAPLAPTLEPAGIKFVEATVRSINTEGRRVEVEDTAGGSSLLSYDRLILAAGSVLRLPAVPGFAEHSFSVDDYDGAVALDRHLKQILNDTDRPGRNTVVIVGSGMTGIELAAEMRSRISEHAGKQMAEGARIMLVEKDSAIASGFSAEAKSVIAQALAEAGVELRLSTEVRKVDQDAVTFNAGERITCATTVIAAGMRANPLTEQVPGRRDELGRLHVDDELRVLGVPGVYATGDVARALADDAGNCALMSCQHSLTMGKYAGSNVVLELLGLPLLRYRQPNYTTTLDLGAFGAISTKGWDRQLESYGAEAKKRKRWINEELIYPPVGDRETIIAGGRIDPSTGR